MKHTPGPWHWKGSDLVGADGTTIDEAGLDPNGVHIDGEMEANASIMAAGPDMLNALELAETTILRLNRHNSANGTLDVVRAAIAKAKA